MKTAHSSQRAFSDWSYIFACQKGRWKKRLFWSQSHCVISPQELLTPHSAQNPSTSHQFHFCLAMCC